MENSITLLDTGVATLGVVELPEGAIVLDLKDNILVHDMGDNTETIFEPLPPGNWIILGWSDNLIQEKLWEIGILDYEAWALFLASNGITEPKLILKQVV